MGSVILKPARSDANSRQYENDSVPPGLNCLPALRWCQGPVRHQLLLLVEDIRVVRRPCACLWREPAVERLVLITSPKWATQNC